MRCWTPAASLLLATVALAACELPKTTVAIGNDSTTTGPAGPGPASASTGGMGGMGGMGGTGGAGGIGGIGGAGGMGGIDEGPGQCLASNSLPGTVDAAHGFRGAGPQVINSLVVNSKGHPVVAGYFTESLSIQDAPAAGQAPAPLGSRKLFVRRLSAAGNVLGSLDLATAEKDATDFVSFETTGSYRREEQLVRSHRLAIAQDDRLWLSGPFEQALSVASQTLLPAGAASFYLLRLDDKQLTVQAGRAFTSSSLAATSPNHVVIHDVSVQNIDNNNSVVVTGEYTHKPLIGCTIADNTPPTCTGSCFAPSNGFYARYDEGSLDCKSAKEVGPDTDHQVLYAAVDTNLNTPLVGGFFDSKINISSELTFDLGKPAGIVSPASLVLAGSCPAAVTRMRTGNTTSAWAGIVPKLASMPVTCSLTIAAIFSKELKLTDTSSALQAHSFVAGGTSFTAASWAHRIRPVDNGSCNGSCNVNSCHVRDIAIDGNDHLVAVGSCNAHDGSPIAGVRIGSGNLGDAAIGQGGFIIKFDTQGQVLWQKSYAHAQPNAVYADRCNNVFVAGSITKPTTFGTELHSPNGTDGFLIQLAP